MGGVSSTLDPSRGRGGEPAIVIPDDYVVPPWPGLYIPTFYTTIQQTGVFLYDAEDIWHFTLWWTIVLFGGLIALCSIFASLTLFLSLTLLRQSPETSKSYSDFRVKSTPHSSPITQTRPQPNSTSDPNSKSKSTSNPNSKSNPNPIHTHSNHRHRPRPPLWPVFLIPIISCAVAAVVALVTATVIGFALAAVYSAGAFSMSTWVPFLWALIVVMVLIISSYSTLTPIL